MSNVLINRRSLKNVKEGSVYVKDGVGYMVVKKYAVRNDWYRFLSVYGIRKTQEVSKMTDNCTEAFKIVSDMKIDDAYTELKGGINDEC